MTSVLVWIFAPTTLRAYLLDARLTMADANAVSSYRHIYIHTAATWSDATFSEMSLILMETVSILWQIWKIRTRTHADSVGAETVCRVHVRHRRMRLNCWCAMLNSFCVGIILTETLSVHVPLHDYHFQFATSTTASVFLLKICCLSIWITWKV